MADRDSADPRMWRTPAESQDAVPPVQAPPHQEQAILMAEMLVMFLKTLQQHDLSHAEALYLAAHVWRAP